MGITIGTLAICDYDNKICYDRTDTSSRKSILQSRIRQDKMLTELHGEKQYFTLYKNDFIELKNPEHPNIVSHPTYIKI